MTSGEFKQRYLGYHAVLYRTTFSLTHDACNAEDLLQELYLKLWQKRDSLPELSNIESYLSIMMRRLHIDMMRQKHIDSSAGLDSVQNLCNDSDVAMNIEIQEEEEALLQIIESLPLKEKSIVKMYLLDDMTYEEIHRGTGLTCGNIRIIVMRAKNKIKERFLKRDKYEY